MKITSERLPESQVVLEIEVDHERVEKSMDQAYKRLVGKYRIPGFRPGKAPRIMFERYVGRDTLMREALEKLVPQVYEEAVKEESLDPIDEPKFEIPTLDPLLIKATVPLRPAVDLGDYRSVRIEREPVAAEAEEIDRTLENLRKQYATLQPVERPAQTGDVLSADVRAEVDGRQLLDEQNAELRVNPESLTGLPGLADKLVGAEKGQSYDYEVDVPDDYTEASLAGKRAAYHVAVHEVKEEKLPDLDDAFASEVGEGFPSLVALRERIENNLRVNKQESADREYERKVLDEVMSRGHLEYPPVLVDREIDHMISEQTGQSRSSLETALRRAGRSEEEFLAELRPSAVQRVERSLGLTQVAELEGISVSPEEIAEELNRLADPSTPSGVQMRQVLESQNGREFLERSVLTRRVYERLRDIGEGKELPPPPVILQPLEAASPTSLEPGEPEGPEGTEQETVTVSELAAVDGEAETQPDTFPEPPEIVMADTESSAEQEGVAETGTAQS